VIGVAVKKAVNVEAIVNRRVGREQQTFDMLVP
jgi:hypothetical protein